MDEDLMDTGPTLTSARGNPAGRPGRGTVIFVCGAFKSGTSLVTAALQAHGYSNPAVETTPRDFGRGLHGRYRTLECRRLRAINKAIIADLRSAGWTPAVGICSRPIPLPSARLAEEYLCSIRESAVLKDPYFAFTLHLWLLEAARLGFGAQVVFTTRNKLEAEAAWRASPLTNLLLRRNSDALVEMVALRMAQQRFCAIREIAYTVLGYSSSSPGRLQRSMD